MKNPLFLICIFCLSFFIFNLACLGIIAADTIFMKNGEELKGIVVEDYVDRVKFSTEKGETEISKSDIKDIFYDLRAQNLIKLGDFHRDKGNLARAYIFYHKAYQIDPSYELAVTRYNYITSMLLRRPQEQLEEKIDKQKAILRASRGIVEIKEGVSSVSQEKLKQLLGIEVTLKDERPYVNKISVGSQADKAGIKEADYITAVWNRLTGYMGLEDVYDAILSSNTGEIKLTIERSVNFKKEEIPLGINLDITPKGLSITNVLKNSSAQKRGFLKSDVIDKINGKSTRYMPLKEAINLIESPDKEIAIIIQRDITVWLGRG